MRVSGAPAAIWAGRLVVAHGLKAYYSHWKTLVQGVKFATTQA